jgi:hypothetical protein
MVIQAQHGENPSMPILELPLLKCVSEVQSRVDNGKNAVEPVGCLARRFGLIPVEPHPPRQGRLEQVKISAILKAFLPEP